jgi:hypothetical protein
VRALLLMLMLEQHRWKKLRNAGRGFIDGIAGRFKDVRG